MAKHDCYICGEPIKKLTDDGYFKLYSHVLCQRQKDEQDSSTASTITSLREDLRIQKEGFLEEKRLWNNQLVEMEMELNSLQTKGYSEYVKALQQDNKALRGLLEAYKENAEAYKRLSIAHKNKYAYIKETTSPSEETHE